MKIPVISVCASLLLSACQLSETAVDPVPMPLDPHSYADPAEAVAHAYRLTLARPPSPAELAAYQEYLALPENQQHPQEAWAGIYHALFSCVDFRYL